MQSAKRKNIRFSMCGPTLQNRRGVRILFVPD